MAILVLILISIHSYSESDFGREPKMPKISGHMKAKDAGSYIYSITSLS